MIWMDIEGGTHIERARIELAFWFGLKELMPRKQNLDVTISLCDTDEDVCGNWYGTKGDSHFIELQTGQETSDLITALFHEMVHFRQCERSELMEDTLPYYDRPYEVEAYKLQEELWNRYLEKNSQKDITTIC